MKLIWEKQNALDEGFEVYKAYANGIQTIYSIGAKDGKVSLGIKATPSHILDSIHMNSLTYQDIPRGDLIMSTGILSQTELKNVDGRFELTVIKPAIEIAKELAQEMFDAELRKFTNMLLMVRVPFGEIFG